MRILIVIAIASHSIILSAQTVAIRGTIKARKGAAIIVQASDSPKVVVLLIDKTQVSQIQGALEARRKEMSMAALIPGLQIQAEGTYDDRDQLVATQVKFQGSDLERAQSIYASLPETRARAQFNTGQTARFGQLDNYYILDEVTVRFGNRKITIGSPYQTKLLELAKKAKAIEDGNIQVVGYAATMGSVPLNQQITEDRVGSVTAFLVQAGTVPRTNLMAPGAMGENRHFGDDETAESLGQNRRVVVRVLQNKGISGPQSLR